MPQPIFRFAPSPTGYMHLGNAYSALLNEKMAREDGGRLLLRIEDIDHMRCRPEFVRAIYDDLQWLGISFEPEVRVQSQHFDLYREIVQTLAGHGLAYRCKCTRRDLQKAKAVALDPEGQPLYPGNCRHSSPSAETEVAWRIDMERALAAVGRPLFMEEQGRDFPVDPTVWGDVIIARKDIGTSYHLSVVADDALQGVTDIVRGEELLAVTSIHRILQELLGYPAPRYHHHKHIKHDDGRKLSKSAGDTTLRELRVQGVTAVQLRAMLGF
jgi:glutamyl-Q tRNA(Asp) synthetase